MVEIIRRKRDGETLHEAELEYFIHGILQGRIPDYQSAAFLMAVFFRGMDNRETALLCRLMTQSGSVLKLDDHLPTADKHSTGGVGDKTTFIASPMAAALGLYIAKMSGRGLGHTGGTIDKLESIPGFRTELSPSEFVRIYRETGLCVAGQTGDMAPADKILYSLRDVTATVDSIPLIAASVMSKKLAGGAQNIVLDVKTGDGSFMKDLDQALKLAGVMVEIGIRNGKKVSALITAMDQPLGACVGNALEVEESIEVLRGDQEGDLLDLSVALAGEMLHLTKGIPVEEAMEAARKTIKNGKALEKLEAMIRAQGGEARVLKDFSLFPSSRHVLEVLSPRNGYVGSVRAGLIGKASMSCGAGRMEKDAAVDHSAGIRLCKHLGDWVRKGECLAVAHTSMDHHEDILREIRNAYVIQDWKPEKKPLIYARVTSSGTDYLG